MNDRCDITPPYRKKSVSEKLGLTKVNPVSDFMQIDKFDGIFEFLSLNSPSKVIFSGFEFPTALHALHFIRFEHQITPIKQLKEDSTSRIKLESDSKFAYNGQHKNNVGVEVIKLAYDIVNLSSDEIYNSDLVENHNWTVNRLKWTEMILRDKFRRNAEYRKSLLDTGDRQIVYVTPYDSFLGSYSRKGQNQLGRIIQSIRADIASNTEIENWIRMCAGVHDQASEWSKLSITETKPGEEYTSKTINLEKKSYYLIGRLPTCDLQPLNPSISRIHGAIYIDESTGKFQIISFNDKSGINLNNSGMMEINIPKQLHDEDKFTLGVSNRIYKVQLDNELLIFNLEKQRKDLEREMYITKYNVADEIEKIIKGCKEIVVLNVSYKTNRQDLYDFFEPCGEIDHIKIPHSDKDRAEDEDLKVEKGIAFIKFVKEKSAANALEKNGTSLNGRVIQVRYCNKSSMMGRDRMTYKRERD